MKDQLRGRTGVMRRFLLKVHKTSRCWYWKGVKHRQGYGFFRLNPSGNMTLAHVASYHLFKGDTNGNHVLHSCDNPGCVNPGHLKLGTHTDNMRDASRKGRLDLSVNKVKAIRRAIISGAKEKDICSRFNISRAAVYRIRHNISYKLV